MKKIYCEVRGKSFYDDEFCWYQQNKVKDPTKCCFGCSFFKTLPGKHPVLNSSSLPVTRKKGRRSAVSKTKSKTKGLPFLDSEGAGSDSHKLSYLVYLYKQFLKEAQEKAMYEFWWAAENSDIGDSFQWITDGDISLLKEAASGSLEAIQYLIEKNPKVLYLPFVADKIIGVLLEYKYSQDPKVRENIRKVDWPGLLPNRTGRKVHILNEDLIELMKFYMESKKITKRKASEEVAKKYSISAERLHRMGSAGKKGRPRKT